MDRTLRADLARRTGFPRASIYLPAFSGGEAQQDPIRLHNALDRVSADLVTRGLRRPDAETFLDEARRRTRDQEYWNRTKGAVAVFIEPDETLFVELPEPVGEVAWVGDRYYLRPLLTERITRDHYVLAISRGAATLYRAHGARLTEVPIDVPQGTDAVRAQYDFDDNLGWHPNANRGQGGGGPVQRGGAGDVPQFHALGRSPEDFQDVLLEQYLIGVAKGVDPLLAETNTVLVFAGGPREVGWLRGKLSHGRIPETFVGKNPAGLSHDELGQLAWSIAEPVLRSERDAALDQMRRSLGNPQVPGTTDLAQILAAASAGRVHHLFVDPTVQIWGRYDETAERVEHVAEQSHEDVDLIDQAAVHAFRHGAPIETLTPEEASALGPIGALLRW